MAGLFDSATAYAEISDSTLLSWSTSSEWTITGFVYFDTSLGSHEFNYIYSHAPPLSTQAAFNVIHVRSTNALRLILDWAGGNLLDYTTATAFFTANAWNRFVITYNGTTITIAINGVSETTTPPVLPDINPAGVARIGNSTVSPIGTRWYSGRIAETSKYNRSFTTSDATAFSKTFLSPEFAQVSQAWHIPMFTNQVWDLKGGLTIVASGGMKWGRHAPVVYPSKSSAGMGLGAGGSPSGDSTYRNFRIG